VEGEGFSKCDSDSLEGSDGKTSYKSESEPERGSGDLKDVPLVPFTGGDLSTPFHGLFICPEGLVPMLSVGRYLICSAT